MIRTSRIWLFALLAVTVAACTSSPGTAAPQSTTQAASSTGVPTTNSALPYGGAPKVSNPLPLSVLSGDPCADALTTDQTRTVFNRVVSGERSDSGALGPTCDWSTPDTGALVLITYDSTHDGLSSVYQNTKPQTIVWRENSVQGFPAAAYATDDGAQDRACNISVGITDSATVDIDLTIGTTGVAQGKDPCTADLTIADMVVGNLKQKAGS